MNFGSVVFVGQNKDLLKVTDLVENETILVDSVTEISEAIDVEIEGNQAVLFTMSFTSDQWVDISQLQDEVGEHIDVVHALTDSENYIEVISTNGDYDIYEDRDQECMVDLAKVYHLPFKEDEAVVDDEDDEDDEEINDVYNWD